jgi:CPA2 family monovalent cation:H+ antiporter-2
LLRQSVIAGYIAAGLVLSPFTPGPVGDVESIERLADIGVVMLMFGVGVHFSLRQLAASSLAVMGAAIQMPVSILIGLVAALAAGWTWREGLFLGAVAAISSSIVLTKLLEERGEEGAAHGRIAIAWGIAQDLATIALVVLLSGITEAGDNLAPTLGLAVLKAAAFITAMVVVGTRALPWMLIQVARLGSRELFILAVGGLSLGTAVLSEQFGLSLALGAFIAGMVVSESDISYNALGEVLPIRDVFAALFFVSVGMLVDPSLIIEHIVLWVVLVGVVLAKGAVIVLVTLAVLRYPLHTAVMAGLGLAQSAEFSFILARQGQEAGVVSNTVFSLMLSATAATTLLAPLLYRLAPVAERGLSRVALPPPRALPEPAQSLPVRNHVVICGAGRVGSLVASVLRQRGQRYVLIEMDRRRAEALRAAGEPVIYGNAAHPPVLAQAALPAARTLVVAVPDPVTAHQIVQEARRIAPRLDIVVRAVSSADADALRALGAAEAVIAERELALEMTRHTLHRIGVSTLEAQALLQRLRLGSSDENMSG